MPYKWLFHGIVYIKIISIIIAVLSTFMLLFHFEYIIEGKTDVSRVILVDVSKSMLKTDILPNRLEALKKTVKQDIQIFHNDYISIIVFSGKPFTQIPFTKQFEDIASLIDSIHPDMLHSIRELSGTNIGNALLLALQKLKETEKSKKEIYLYTDGAATIGFDPILAARLAKQENITINTIAIGNEDLEYDPELLKKIALLTDGSYREIKKASDFQEVMNHRSFDFFFDINWMYINIFSMIIFFILEFLFIPFRRHAPSY